MSHRYSYFVIIFKQEINDLHIPLQGVICIIVLKFSLQLNYIIYKSNRQLLCITKKYFGVSSGISFSKQNKF